MTNSSTTNAPADTRQTDHQRLLQALRILALAYPRQDFGKGNLAVYARYLDRYPVVLVERAIDEWIIGGRVFFPSVAEIAERIAERVTGLPTPGEAWQLVQDRMRASYRPELAPPWDVPESVKTAVTQCGGMYALRRSDHPGADEKRFLDLYGVIRVKTVQEIQITGVPDDLLARAMARDHGHRELTT